MLEGAHVVAHAHKELLEREYIRKRGNFPISVNDAMNGLLLCPTCHSYYDLPLNKKSKIRLIHILQNGDIQLNGEAKDINYRNLTGKKVPWTIGDDCYPTARLLKFALSLAPIKGKRSIELVEEEEEGEAEIPSVLFSMDSNSDDSDDANRKKAKKRRVNAKGINDKQSSELKRKEAALANEMLRYGLSHQETGVYSSSKIV